MRWNVQGRTKLQSQSQAHDVGYIVLIYPYRIIHSFTTFLKEFHILKLQELLFR